MRRQRPAPRTEEFFVTESAVLYSGGAGEPSSGLLEFAGLLEV
jgi:hypothetical protein